MCSCVISGFYYQVSSTTNGKPKSAKCTVLDVSSFLLLAYSYVASLTADNGHITNYRCFLKSHMNEKATLSSLSNISFTSKGIREQCLPAKQFLPPHLSPVLLLTLLNVSLLCFEPLLKKHLLFSELCHLLFLLFSAMPPAPQSLLAIQSRASPMFLSSPGQIQSLLGLQHFAHFCYHKRWFPSFSGSTYSLRIVFSFVPTFLSPIWTSQNPILQFTSAILSHAPG